MARKHNIIIIGAGLFGSIAAKAAVEAGHSVTVIDSREPYAASKASGCVLAPSWLSSLTAEDRAEGGALLDNLYNVVPVEFKTNLGATFKASRIDPDEILFDNSVLWAEFKEKVEEVGDGFVATATRRLKGKVLVAAGIGSPLLVAMPAMRGLWGASARIQGKLDTPRINAYAPYRQAVGFQLNKKEVWVGDGTALIENTWMKETVQRRAKLLERAGEMLGPFTALGKHQINTGARPYVENHKAGYFSRVSASTWVSTGGAKNGTMLAAVQALRFLKELP